MLTATKIKALAKGETKKHADGGGLYFCVRPQGCYWMLRYTAADKKRRELTLGHYPAMGLHDARAEAATTRAGIKQRGADPVIDQNRPQAHITTVDDLAQDWLTNDIERRLKHPQIPQRVYRKELSPKLGKIALSQITPMDIRAAIDAIVNSDRPSIANDALMYCKQLFRHGIRLGLITSNPAEAFNVHQAGGVEKSRHRALNLDELKVVFRVFRENPQEFTRDNYLAVALLLVLGVRKGELIAAKWEEFDFDKALWALPHERSKTGAAITIPLPTQAAEWLQELKTRAYGSDYAFPARRVSKRRQYISDDTLNHALAKLFGQKVRSGSPPINRLGEAGIEHFTIHDLRRTCRSLLSSLGIPGHIAERCLNHKLKGVEGIYDRYDYMDERRDALQRLSDLVSQTINLKQTH
ncbi:MAG: integrase arm-type DNA-binding domain-containing protein [Pseudomonadota bacterium]|nr:integrase arm-type DNA-binding domain-containing protein [Pseudomonadota bacterium]